MEDALKLLIVEDSEDDALLLRHQLTQGGVTVAARRIDGEADLLHALAEGGWDLVIGDYRLPGFDGLEALRLVKIHDPDLPFIMISGARGEEFAVEAMRAGAGDYITKDNLPRLIPAIERELETREARRARRQADQALQARNRLLVLLSDLAEHLLYAQEPQDAASTAYRMIAGELDLHVYFNFLAEPDGSLRLDSWEGIPERAARLISRLDPGEAVCGLVARTRRAAHVTGIPHSDDPRLKLLKNFGLRACYCSSLCAGERLLGTLSFGTRSRDSFSTEEIDFMQTVGRYVALSDERLRAEKERLASEERFRSFFENAAVGATELDLQSRLLRVNDRFSRLLGFPGEVLVGRNLHTLTHPEDAPQEVEGFKALSEGKRDSFEMEKRYLRRDGSSVWVQETTGVVRSAGGSPDHLTCIIQDITPRKQAEMGRENLLAELESTINAIADAVVIYGPEGQILRLNPAAEKMFGFTARNKILSIAERKALLRAETPEGHPFPAERFPSVRALRGETVLSEVIVYHPSGREKPLWGAMSAAPIISGEGKIIGAVSTVTDITALQDLLQEREIYIHTISHDLRTPLSVVLGHAELLELTCGDDETLMHVRAILKGTERMEAMIENLVEAARLEGGEILLEKEEVRLAEFIPAFLQQSSTALETSRISIDVPPDIPSVHVDPVRLERILTNLLTNALKYSPDDSTVELSTRSEGNEVLIAVRDRGQGIDPKDLPHIFNRFHRPKEGRRSGGVGLGLYITRSLVEAHGGRIEVQSTPGRGSVFSVTLPASV